MKVDQVMTLSDFAKMLYPYIGNGVEKYKFLISLIDQIVEEPLQKDFENNPLSDKGPSIIEKIYNGTRDLSKKDVGKILSNLDKERFIQFILSFSEQSIMLIGNALRDKKIEVDLKVDKIAEMCYEQLVAILKDIVEPKAYAMLYKFKQACDECRIEEFIQCDPTDRLHEDFIDVVDEFIPKIKEWIIIPYSKYQKESIYKKIMEFTDLLYKYNEYLPFHMRPLINSKYFVPLHDDDDIKWALDFQKEVMNYRKLISNKYNEIYKAKK